MEQAEKYLNEIPMWTRKKHTLSEVRDFLEELGNPHRAFRAIHVAGTNGKGSVCSFLTSSLGQAGYRTGTFVSPHLVNIRERFLMDGKMVSEDSFEKSFEEVLKAVHQMEEKGYSHPSFFEFLFYMAMVLFRRESVDIAVIETGLGGRRDTTNVLEHPCACVITSISMDHTAYLGDTLEKIAGEKAGIIKEKVPVIFDASLPETASVMEQTAKKQQAEGYPVTAKDIPVQKTGNGYLTAEALLRTGEALSLTIPFEAKYQAVNAMLTVRTLEVLREKRVLSITNEEISEGIRRTRWAGRMEQAAEGVYLDGAHNPGGIAAFLQAAKEIRKRRNKKAFLLFAAVSDKDYDSMAEMLCKEMDWAEIGVVHMENERGLTQECLSALFKTYASCEVSVFAHTKDALEQMRKKAKNELLFCAGSLYLIGELKAALEGGKENYDQL